MVVSIYSTSNPEPCTSAEEEYFITEYPLQHFVDYSQLPQYVSEQ